MEEMHQHKVEQMIKSAEGSAAWIWGKEEEDARLSDRCEAKRNEFSKHWQCDEDVQNMQDKPWRNEELRRSEEALPRLKEGDLEEASRLYKAKTGE